jgi:hypothetical protein
VGASPAVAAAMVGVVASLPDYLHGPYWLSWLSSIECVLTHNINVVEECQPWAMATTMATAASEEAEAATATAAAAAAAAAAKPVSRRKPLLDVSRVRGNQQKQSSHLQQNSQQQQQQQRWGCTS